MTVPNYMLSLPNMLTFNSPMSYIGGFGGNYGLGFWDYSTKKLKKEETYDEYVARIKKEKAAIQKEREKLENEIKQAEEALAPYEEAVKKAKNAKVDKQSGALIEKETMEQYKQLPTWKKIVRAGGNMLHGTWKLATGLVGMEDDPETGKQKWNWKKCLKNVAIAAGCIALTCIPGVGPFISTGLLASGVLAGGIGIGKGIVKACNAKTPDEIDKGFQDIGSGLTIGVSSALGLRSLGKSLSVSHTTGAVSRSMGNNCVSQFFKDATINAFKATKVAAASQRAAVAQNGWWSTFKDNLPKFGKAKFEKKLQDSNSKIDARLKDIDARLHEKSVSRVEKDALKFEREALIDMSKQQNTMTTKVQWEQYGRENSAKFGKDVLDTYKKGDLFKYNTQRKGLKLTKDNMHFLTETKANLDNFASQAVDLANARNTSMKWMSLSSKNADSFENYMGCSKTTGLGRFWQFVRPAQKTTFLGKLGNWIKFPFSIAWNAMGITFKPWELMKKSPAAAFYKFEATVINPVYEESMFKSLLGMGDQPIVIPGQDGKSVQVLTTKDLAELNDSVNEAENNLSKKQDKIDALNRKERELCKA